MSRLLIAAVIALLASGCAEAPRTVAVGPAAVPPAAAALRWAVETPDGRLLGSATAFGPRRLLTNAHVLDAAHGAPLHLRRGAERLPVRAARRLAGMDVAVLQVEATEVAAPVLRPAAPAEAERLLVLGPGSGSGQALAPSAARRFGDDLIAARLPVAPGYSGAPVVDAEGRLVGIVTAAVAPDLDVARRLAARSGGEAPSAWMTLVVPVRAILAGLPAGAGAR